MRGGGGGGKSSGSLVVNHSGGDLTFTPTQVCGRDF